MSKKATCLSKLNILYMAANVKTIMNFNYTAILLTLCLASRINIQVNRCGKLITLSSQSATSDD